VKATELAALGVGLSGLIEKADEIRAEGWLLEGLPRGSGLPPVRVLAKEMAHLSEELSVFFRHQLERYATYIRTHPPYQSVGDLALKRQAEPSPEARFTYALWLDEVVFRREWWDKEHRRFQVDEEELTEILVRHLEEALGTGADAQARALGLRRPGFRVMSRAQGLRLLAELDTQGELARALRTGTARGRRAVALFDGAGRLVGAAALAESKKEVRVIVLAALEAEHSGAELALIRGLAGRAAGAEKSLTLQTAAALRAGIELPREADGFLTLSAEGAAAIAERIPLEARFLGEASFDLGVRGAGDWLREHRIKRVVEEVQASTHRRLVETLAQGLEEGESTAGLARRVMAEDERFSRIRGERIARTEVLTANRFGGLKLAQQAGAEEKEWRSRNSHRTRPWHRRAHGQRVPIGEPFVVANRKGELEELMVPGDYSRGASADNTINCRCSVKYHRADEQARKGEQAHGHTWLL